MNHSVRVLRPICTAFRQAYVFVTAVAAGVALAGCGGGGGSQPAPSAFDIDGFWSVTQTLKGSSEFLLLEDQGILKISDSSRSATWRSAATLVRRSFRESSSLRGQTTIAHSNSGVTFTFAFPNYSIRCTYTADLARSPVSTMSGSVECPNRELQGTWSATRGIPEPVALPDLTFVDVADSSTCALATDRRTYCWGQNVLGQLGTGDAVPRLTPTAAVETYALSKISLSTGGGVACGIDMIGAAYCWGNREGGRLGDGFSGAAWEYVTEPVAVAGGHSFIDIAVGGDHACAVADTGDAYCWGHNTRGQLGTGDFSNYAAPQLVAGGIKFDSITAHQLVSCGLTADGSAYCWGDGSSGNLGNGSTDVTNVPVPVSGGLTFASLQLGVWSACGVTTSGAGYCWGFNGNGELGTGAASEIELVPVPVTGGIVWKQISPGIAVTCGVSQAGGAYCWGGNQWGERGDGTFPAADRPAPAPVSGSIVFDTIDADWHTCGVSTDGDVYCWGPGDYGSIGDGMLLDRGVPTPISGS